MRHVWSKLDLGPAQLVCCTLAGTLSDPDFEAWLSEYDEALASARAGGHKLVVLLDTSPASPPSARQRRMQGDWNTQRHDLLQETLLGMGFVVSSIVMRGVITAVHWIKPLPVPHAVYGEIEAAVRWGLERCSAAGIPVSRAQREEARRTFVTQAFAGHVKSS